MSKWVYILRSVHNPSHTYTGISTDLRRRLAEHNAGKLQALRPVTAVATTPMHRLPRRRLD